MSFEHRYICKSSSLDSLLTEKDDWDFETNRIWFYSKMLENKMRKDEQCWLKDKLLHLCFHPGTFKVFISSSLCLSTATHRTSLPRSKSCFTFDFVIEFHQMFISGIDAASTLLLLRPYSSTFLLRVPEKRAVKHISVISVTSVWVPLITAPHLRAPLSLSAVKSSLTHCGNVM